MSFLLSRERQLWYRPITWVSKNRYIGEPGLGGITYGIFRRCPCLGEKSHPCPNN